MEPKIRALNKNDAPAEPYLEQSQSIKNRDDPGIIRSRQLVV